MQLVDFVAHSDGRFTVLGAGGHLFDLVYGDTANCRVWRSVDAPFTPTKLSLRSDGSLFVADSNGAVWQRLPDTRDGSFAWRRIAGSPT
jgi:hypothetical protein